MEFPFVVPDFSTATGEELSTLLTNIRNYAQSLASGAATAETVEALTACRDLANQARETMSTRQAHADLAASITGLTEPAPEPEPEPEPEPLVAAAHTRNPTVREVAARRAGQEPDLGDVGNTAPFTITAAAEFPGFFGTGQTIDTFASAARALSQQLDRYPQVRSAGKQITADTTIITTGEGGGHRVLAHELRNYTRHGGVQFRRNGSPELTVTEQTVDPYKVARFAGSEKRLAGGSLLSSFRSQVKAGTPITAAAGWCAPSEPIYELRGLSTLEGLLDLPELPTERGGWQIPANGGPNFATVWSGIGNSGTTHLTEAQVEAESPSKYCWDIPCPSFSDVRLGVDYVCLTGGLLQQRGYPEVVQWFSEQAMNALPHKINQGVIAAIVAASGAATIVPADPSGDDAIAALLSAVELAIMDARYRNRMGVASTLEIVLPLWVLAQMRAAGSRRANVDFVGLTDAQIVEWFAIRGAVPRFVYDWQDSFSGLVAGPGGAVALTGLPTTVNFLIYPAGTWVKAVQSVINLDTVYDSTKLLTNEYTALFVEDGWAMLQMLPLSRLYTAPVDPSGCLCGYPNS
jgi:hypothetical protein